MFRFFQKNKYQSYDLDFIERYSSNRKKISNVMIELGFFEENRYFKHKDTNYFVEFPSGPLSIGSEPVKEIEELSFSTGILLIISATECVKDRLAAYFYWDDKQSLEQALLVSKENKINYQEIQRWLESEGLREKWLEIMDKFEIN